MAQIRKNNFLNLRNPRHLRIDIAYNLLNPTSTSRHFPRDHLVHTIDHDMCRAGHTWIKAANRTQNVDPLKVITLVGFDNRRVHHRFFVGSRCAPRGRWCSIECIRRYMSL